MATVVKHTTFLVENSKIETATFPYKLALSEASFKPNGMGSSKGTYQKKRNLASSCLFFFFLKKLFQFKNILQTVDFMYQLSKCPY